jgi:hypothetical protein
LTRYYLNALSGEVGKFGNLVVGNNNQIDGRKNIIIGNRGTVSGSNNWVFVSDFKGNTNSNLVVGIWKIDMLRLQFLPINPMMAISYIDDAANAKMKSKYLSAPRQVCQFGSWTNNMSSDQQNFYSKFNGFNVKNQSYSNQSFPNAAVLNTSNQISAFRQSLFNRNIFKW